MNLNLIEVNDLEAPQLAVYAHASEAELLHFYEPDGGVFIAETANVVLRALEAGYMIESLLVEKQRLHIEAAPVFEKILSLYGQTVLSDIPVYTADHETVKELTGYNLVRGLWTVMRRKKTESLKSFCRDKNRLAVIYDVVNPTNVGAIIRSAAALGMDGVLLTAGSVDPLTRRSARVSMGTVFEIPWTVAPKDVDPARVLPELGFHTAAMALTDNSVGPDDESLKKEDRLAVFLGTEGTGLPRDVIESCSSRIMIPMYHGVDSLNVAAASAVIFWELCKGGDNDL